MLRPSIPPVQSPPRVAGSACAVCRAENRPSTSDGPSPHYRLVEARDGGRIQVYQPFTSLLTENQLDSFDAIWNLVGGSVVRRVGSRETRRIELRTPQGLRPFFLKRFGAPRWRDTLRALLHLGWPIHGAHPEWDAIWQFIAAGIPTVTPVACGEAGKRSLLLTEGLASHCNLLEFANSQGSGFATGTPAECGCHNSTADTTTSRRLLVRVAEIAQRMHAAGLHHQDFYLNHLLLCSDAAEAAVHVIDLGRARRQQQLGMRWIIKDLSQLNFSAHAVSVFERLRFLRLYLARPFCTADRQLVRRIAAKSRRIAAHTVKHDL